MSTEHQWEGTRRRFYADVPGLVLLEIDPQRLGAPVRFEEGEPGEDFPHLYGELNPDAVVRVTPL